MPPLPAYNPFPEALPIRDRRFGNDTTDTSPRSRRSQVCTLSHRRCLPSRVSQSYLLQQVPAAQAAPPPTENKLRRKTPNGTVDAGYDGSPCQLHSGPPPYKHIIIDASADSDPLALPDAPSGLVARTWQGSPLVPGHSQDIVLQAHSLSAPPWSSTAQWSAPHFGSEQTSYSDHVQGMLGMRCEPLHFGANIYQPIVRANEYNVRAVCPSLPGSGHFPSGHPVWQRSSLPWDCTALEHTRTYAPLCIQPDQNLIGRPLICNVIEQLSPGVLDCLRSSGRVPDTIESQTADSLAQEEASAVDASYIQRAPGRSGRFGFKEKALVHAHQCYLDLLAFLQANGRANFSSAKSGTGEIYRLPAYPKPRKTGPLTSRSPCGGSSESPYHDYATDSDGQYGKNPHFHPMTGSDQFDVIIDKQHNGRYSFPLLTSAYPYVQGTPLDNAVFSLEVLNSLCEQSGWRWLDGMLLGGCLHYGLEHYEIALKWFSRILEIDSR